MGTVWRASDLLLGRDVAIKEVVYPDYLTAEDHALLRERTMREARAAARFTHPNVTTVHDVVEEDGRPWIVMEFVPSRTLAQLVHEQGPLPVERVARIGMDLIDALQAAHQAGIVHRDVKPGNVLIDAQWRAWLTDFGIATSSLDSSITTEGVLLGSPSYMSPERARNEQSGPPGDLWSLGATLYTAVEGRPPFERGEAMATLLAVANEPPNPPAAAGSLAPVLLGCLTKEPTQRMDAEQVRSALERALRDPPTALLTPPPGPTADSRARGDAVERGNLVERIDLHQLSALAATTAGRVASKAARRVNAHLDRSGTERPTLVEPQPGAQGVAPPSARPASEPAPRRWRFRRRWVAVPLLVVILLVVALVIGAVLLLGALGDAVVR